MERGFAATSTSAIGERVGIRQASLYYHFPSTEQMLKVLLMRTVEPSSRVAANLDAAPASADVRPAALISFDTDQLARSAHNLGTLDFLPEIRNDLLEPFRIVRARLQDTYAALIAASGEAEVPLRTGSGRERGVRVGARLFRRRDLRARGKRHRGTGRPPR